MIGDKHKKYQVGGINGVEELYRIIKTNEANNLSAGHGCGSVPCDSDAGGSYGEWKQSSMQRIVWTSKLRQGLDSESRFLDVGSGSCKALLHVAHEVPKIKLCCGVEIDDIRFKIGNNNIIKTNRIRPSECRVENFYYDASKLDSFEPFTHIYMADVAFPPKIMQQLGYIFNRSEGVKALISNKSPESIIDRWNFSVKFLGNHSVKLEGSDSQKQVYYYMKENPVIGAKEPSVSGKRSMDKIFEGLKTSDEDVSFAMKLQNEFDWLQKGMETRSSKKKRITRSFDACSPSSNGSGDTTVELSPDTTSGETRHQSDLPDPSPPRRPAYDKK